MDPIVIVYATREGHTKRIAEYLAQKFPLRGIPVTVLEARKLPPAFSLIHYSGVIIAASVHLGQHEPEIADFVKLHRADLYEMCTAFISVSLSQAGAQDELASFENRAKAAEDVRQTTERFFLESLWHPTLILPVAGALMYEAYNFLLRFIMKQIARQVGASTDTSRNHVFTRWQDLDHFVADFSRQIVRNEAESDRNVRATPVEVCISDREIAK
jgi:menaquinone-dependent protoporphyrinogen oxidase